MIIATNREFKPGDFDRGLTMCLDGLDWRHEDVPFQVLRSATFEEWLASSRELTGRDPAAGDWMPTGPEWRYYVVSVD